MKLIRRLLAVASSIAVGLGISSANASLPPPDQSDQPGGLSGFEVEVTKEELSAVLLDLVQKKPVVGYQVAARFKDSDDQGRPDLFGDPGKPVIGPPGKSGY